MIHHLLQDIKLNFQNEKTLQEENHDIYINILIQIKNTKRES